LLEIFFPKKTKAKDVLLSSPQSADDEVVVVVVFLHVSPQVESFSATIDPQPACQNKIW
jgi:hypothetical protein